MHSCRCKFYDWKEELERGKCSADTLEELLPLVRRVLGVLREDMDVQDINRWTLDHFGVQRGRHDCYPKWRSMTQWSDRLAFGKGCLRHLLNGMSLQERFDHLVNQFAQEDSIDLPLWD